jgi:hypothetical protein
MVQVLVGVALTLALFGQSTAKGPQTRDEIASFMRSARVVNTAGTTKGVTRPLRLTLSDGAFTHDAVFQAINQRKALMQFPTGESEINFVDSWRYNVGAYQLAGVLGLADMMPVTIEYRFRGTTGSLSWWMESLMDEGERVKKGIQPPDNEAWNNDMFRQRVFMELVRDTDRNVGNVLVSPEWRVIMLDFTRAFRLQPTIRAVELMRIDRALLGRLEALSLDAVTEATRKYLSRSEINAVMKRRDLIVTHYHERVKQLGEAKVLY